MSKKVLLKIFSVLLIIFLIIGLTTFILFEKVVSHPLNKNKNFVLYVNKGDSLYNIVDKLNKQGSLKNSFLTKLYIKNNYKNNTNIKPGTYEISSNVSLQKLIDDLEKGIYNENAVKVTIPEGYDIKQIAQLLDKNGIVKKDDFLSTCKDYKLPFYIKRDGEKRYALEGYLFPDTYEFEKNSSSEEVIKIMLSRFEEVITEIKKNNNKEINDNNIENFVTMASIVEKEALQDSDRPKVASVFYNRLNKKMKLQSDATVLYALDAHKEVVRTNDLKVKSPYNTYYVEGLPVGPICSPGKASLEAAINPEKSNNIYFIIIKDGPHFFTDNYSKFLDVKKQYIDSKLK
ncbi:endolytic transglycosylase MltG [Clostridium sp. JN-9]|uniref:endolytic transglycosylase MltG n=1 Tax=Clostridium sp. JN-9 TaxID=2507159 RepID=UPI000FFE0154|nr:endolytic transglycosylase MltG [Clostridium sp. JN-9]QAT40107.1 endolytic transglycosylase MltG [Clostridium sp. JN-9]